MLTTDTIQTLIRSSEWDMPRPISPSQLMALNILLEQFTTSRQERLTLAGKLLGTAVLSTKLLTQAQASAILSVAYPLPRPIEEQEIDAEFVRLVADLQRPVCSCGLRNQCPVDWVNCPENPDLNMETSHG